MSFVNWEKLRNLTTAIFKNPNFQFSCQLRKTLKYSLRPAFKSPNFKSKDELRKAIFQFEFHC